MTGLQNIDSILMEIVRKADECNINDTDMLSLVALISGLKKSIDNEIESWRNVAYDEIETNHYLTESNEKEHNAHDI